MGLLSDKLAFGDMQLKEMTSLDRLFEELPVSLDVFVTDQKFMDSPPLSAVQYELVQHIERVYFPETYQALALAPEKDIADYWSKPIRMTNLITAQWGKGGGKDHTVRVSALRIAYLLMCLRSPQTYFGLPSQDFIHMLNIAYESNQAERAFFRPMTMVVKRGWFADKSDPVKNSIRYIKNIEAVSGHSNADSLEGMNLILGVADEIDAFKSKDEMVGLGRRQREASTSAETILDMLKTSASTRFPETYKRVAISYPRYLGSTIQSLTESAKRDISEYGEDSIHFVSGPYATWESNPTKRKEQYAKDYREDPIGAAAKYECKPHRAIDPYFRNFDTIRRAIDSDSQPIRVSYEKVTAVAEKTGLPVTVWDAKFHFSPDFKPRQGAKYAMHADLAVRGDRAGISMSHVEKWEERVELIVADDGEHFYETRSFPHIKNDFTITFESDLREDPPREIQIRWARELCYELRRNGFNVNLFTFDGFQSVDSMQLLAAQGIETSKKSTDRDEGLWRNIRDLAAESRLKMPFSQLLMDELEALSKINKKVDHPPNGSKDAADALAGSIGGALELGGSVSEDSSGTLNFSDTFMSGPNPVQDLVVDSLDLREEESSLSIFGMEFD